MLTLEIKLPNGFRFLKLMEFNEFKKMNLHASTQLKDHVTRREAASVVGEYGASGARVSLEFLPPKMQASENKIIASFSSHVPEILFLT